MRKHYFYVIEASWDGRLASREAVDDDNAIRPGLGRNGTARTYGRGESVTTRYESLVYVCERVCDRTERPARSTCGLLTIRH